MLPKIKSIIKEYKKEIRIGLIILLIIIISLVLYKSLFYSNSEKAIYGARLMDIKEHKFENDDKKEVISKISEVEKIQKVEIKVKGRLIKMFITFDGDTSNDDIKAKITDSLNFISDDVKGYYDIAFYSIQDDSGKTKYSVIGYKQKAKDLISFDAF